MSKNGYRLFKNYDPYITSNFGKRISPITGLEQFHQGVDYGTYEEKLPICPPEYGIVKKRGTDGTGANYIYVEFPRINHIGLYYHLDSINTKVGSEVGQDTVLGYTGKTGNATGVHLHFGWFEAADFNLSWDEKRWKDFESYEYPAETIGNPVSRDTTKLQIEVNVSSLRVRKSPYGEIIGYIKKGIYNILDSEENGKYMWYKIGEEMWIAYTEEWGNLYLVDEKEEETIEEENKEIENDKDLPEKLEDMTENLEKITTFFAKILSIFKVVYDFIKKVIKKE